MAVGPDVPERFEIGKRVCVENHFFCGTCYQCTHGMTNLLGELLRRESRYSGAYHRFKFKKTVLLLLFYFIFLANFSFQTYRTYVNASISLDMVKGRYTEAVLSTPSCQPNMPTSSRLTLMTRQQPLWNVSSSRLYGMNRWN